VKHSYADILYFVIIYKGVFSCVRMSFNTFVAILVIVLCGNGSCQQENQNEGHWTTSDEISYFSNPGFPNEHHGHGIYTHTVIPGNVTCAIRLEFLESELSPGEEECNVDAIRVINTGGNTTSPLCGLIQGYSITFSVTSYRAVIITAVIQSEVQKWQIKVSQLKCALFVQGFQDVKECGLKRSHVWGARNSTETDDFERIVNGRPAGPGTYPWQVEILYSGSFCGGSLLSDRWVLTAGHCVGISPASTPMLQGLTVVLGAYQRDDPSAIRMSASRIIRNANYHDCNYDLTLVLLSQPVHFNSRMSPVCIAKDPNQLYVNSMATATGWGKTQTGQLSDYIMESVIPVVSNSQCNSVYGFIDPSHICAGGGTTGTCQGDSGGPLVVQQGGRWTQIGAVSCGSSQGCGIPNIPVVFTRLTAYTDWITMNTAGVI